MGADNSHFKPDANDPYIAFGEDTLFEGVPDATDPAVIVHEYGHAVHEYLLGERDDSAYEEGFCDFLSACWLDRYNTTQYKREEVMLWESADSIRQPPFPRSMKMNCNFNDQCFGDLTGYNAYKAGDIHGSALWAIYENLGGNDASASVRNKAADIIISSYLDALVTVQDNKPLKSLVNGLIQAYKNLGGNEADIKGPYDALGPWEKR
jgi:hypothetical protein